MQFYAHGPSPNESSQMNQGEYTLPARLMTDELKLQWKGDCPPIEHNVHLI